jgi:hypothetical protein
VDYDPTTHTVAEVQAYLAEHPEAAADVVAAEAARSDGTEPRKTVLALAPDASAEQPQQPPAATPGPAGTDAPPTAGSEPTGPTGDQPTASGAQATTLTGDATPQDATEAELAGYYERLEKLSPDQRSALETAMDDGTDWNTMRDDAVVRARFGAHLTQAESQVTPQTGTFVAPQDERRDDGTNAPRGVQLDSANAYNEDGGTVSVADVRGEPTGGGTAQPARGE